MSQVLADIKPYITKKFMAAPCIKEQDSQAICQLLLPRYKNVQLIAKGVFVPISSLPQREPMYKQHEYHLHTERRLSYPEHHYPQDQAHRTLRQTSQGVFRNAPPDTVQ